MNDTLATFANANNLASKLNDIDGRDYVVIDTGDALQPYKVEPENDQANAVVLVTTDPDRSIKWISRRQKLQQL